MRFKIFTFILLYNTFMAAQSYCWPGFQMACFYGDQITRVKLANIDHSESACSADGDGKKDFTTSVPAATLTSGTTYTLTVTLNVNSQAGCRVWFDFNRNSVFEASESYDLGSRTSTGTLTLSVTTPSNASTGLSRVRIMNRKNNVNPMPTANDACHSISNYRGQVKDYAIYIQAQSSLPIELAHFAGYKNGTAVDLEWHTLSETDNDHFDIEKSNDGILWNIIATVKSKGNDHQKKSYNYTDHTPTAGINYYRLKQVDATTEYSYSSIIAVENQDNYYTIYPNPCSDYLSVDLPDNHVPEFYLSNSVGVKINVNYELINNHLIINTTSIEKGVYYLSIFSTTTKIIKL